MIVAHSAQDCAGDTQFYIHLAITLESATYHAGSCLRDPIRQIPCLVRQRLSLVLYTPQLEASGFLWISRH